MNRKKNSMQRTKYGYYAAFMTKFLGLYEFMERIDRDAPKTVEGSRNWEEFVAHTDDARSFLSAWYEEETEGSHV